ncbi:hypothetical protein BWQ96_03205 [Gracilariopsis chorda]|uniref:Uncharacterized protein n=1 Tax=Gracilariopsis chorda TaxID=448386 RepID=A0A2V3IY74_9FLOR|nr:hypothetical protein BWQ96_03205 [Gracilariopsis chorda]|eukprot:PXF47015.1 hypothetical protein BWQ96_03205 [Gracilariopsis chorda]
MEDSIRIVKFSGRAGKDFLLSKARIEALLQAEGLLRYVTIDLIGSSATDEKPLTAKELLDVAKARALMMRALGYKPLHLCLAEQRNPFMMWKKLEDG